MGGKHTPGPWQVSGGRRSDTLYGHGVGPNGNGYVALVTYSDRTAKDHIESLADARLIAAAPDLLEALKELVAEHIKRGPSFDEPLGSSEQSPQINAALAAIAKAEGQS